MDVITIERMVGSQWVRCRLRELKVGDHFRMFRSEEDIKNARPVPNYLGEAEAVVFSSPEYEMSDIGSGRWSVTYRARGNINNLYSLYDRY
jgi:hypothetical protein